MRRWILLAVLLFAGGMLVWLGLREGDADEDVGSIRVVEGPTAPSATSASSNVEVPVAASRPDNTAAPTKADQSADLRLVLGAEWTPRGYLIAAPSQRAAQAGLKTGDIVTMLGARAVGSPDRDARIVDAAREAGGIELGGIRNGKPIVVPFAF